MKEPVSFQIFGNSLTTLVSSITLGLFVEPKIVTPFVTIHTFLLLEANEFNYSVFFRYRDPTIAGYKGQVYADSATFDLTISIHPDAAPNTGQDVATAFITHIQNNDPTVTPASETYLKSDGGTSTWTWEPSPIGMFDIRNVTLIDSVIKSDSTLVLNFNSDVGFTPGFFVLDEPEDGGVHVTIPPVQIPGGLQASTPLFKINYKEQELGNPNAGAYFRITPKMQ
jgi:hypothetical protein